MKAKAVSELRPETIEMRKAFCDTLMEMAEKNRDIVVLDGDLMGAMGTKPFAQMYPEQTLDCGIQEANMVGVAAGLSAAGKIPFVHSFGPFITRRACDQIFMSGAYAKLNVKLVGSDPGITAQINGGTHMPFEDMGIMRGIPQMTIIEPTDVTMLKSVLKQMADSYGMYYMRLVRKSCIKVYEDGSEFEIGKSVMLREGSDVTIIASGYCTAEALKAADLLEKKGISAAVVNMFTWKPIDEEAIKSAADRTGAVVTAENHNVINGLGSAVSEVLVKNTPVPMEMIGVQDQFGEVGNLDYLAERFELKAEHIAEAAVKVIKRKEK
ncbi:transketolase family protein [Clostridium sp. AM58-1XD]|uniref:transketolase family protein n=1 Tax=Clostridium sp. AM58-1XD TaxID=2292307 RepID=UPI0026CAB1BE